MDTIKRNVNEPTFMVTLYDQYKDDIAKIAGSSNVLSPKMNSHDKDSKTFTVINKNSFFSLDFNENTGYVNIYARLVG